MSEGTTEPGGGAAETIPTVPLRLDEAGALLEPRSGMTKGRTAAFFGIACVTLFLTASEAFDTCWPGIAVVWIAAAAAFAALVVGPSRGIVDLVRLRLAAGRARRHGGGPWWFDREWGADGERAHFRVGAARWTPGCVAAAFGAALLTVFTGILGGIPMRTLVWAGLGLPGGAVVLDLARRVARGRLHVAWPSFPQFTGGVVEFHVGTTPGGARIDAVRVILRCVRDVPAAVPFGWFRFPAIEWARSAALEPGAYAAPETDVRVRFAVPPDAPGTDLHARSPVAWELIVLGRIGERECAAKALVPVYRPRRHARPGDDGAAADDGR